MDEQPQQTFYRAMAELVSVCHHVVSLASQQSPSAGVDYLVDYLEECGIENPKLRADVEAWRKHTSGNEILLECQKSLPRLPFD